MSTAPVRSYMPISEQVTAVNGLVTQPWFRFFQTMAVATDASIAANIPLLRAQVNSMLSSVSTLQAQMSVVQDELSMALVPLPIPSPTVDVLPELLLPTPIQDEVLPELPDTAIDACLAQRISDLESWSL